MREITHIVVHCSGGSQDATVENIKKYWKEKLGWKQVGYHYIIEPNGKETQLLSIAVPSNGVKGKNAHIVNVCYIGGIDKFGKAVDNRTPQQKEKLLTRLKALKAVFPKAKIVGHRDLSPDLDKDGVIEKHEWIKWCPCFDAVAEYKSI